MKIIYSFTDISKESLTTNENHRVLLCKEDNNILNLTELVKKIQKIKNYNFTFKNSRYFWMTVSQFFHEDFCAVIPNEDVFVYHYYVDIQCDGQDFFYNIFDFDGNLINDEKTPKSPKYHLIYYKDKTRETCDYIVTEILEQDKNYFKCICEGKGYRNFKVKNIISLKKI